MDEFLLEDETTLLLEDDTSMLLEGTYTPPTPGPGAPSLRFGGGYDELINARMQQVFGG